MIPIAAIGAKAAEPVVAGAVGNVLAPHPSITQNLSGFHKELLRGTGRSEDLVMPVDHELIALCSPERQKDFGNAILNHTVQISDPKGQVITGTVDKVWIDNDKLQLQVGGQTYNINDLRAVYQNPPGGSREVAPVQSGASK